MSIRELTAYQVVCDHCGGTAYDMGAVYPLSDDADWIDIGGIAVCGRHACHNPECGIAVLDSHPKLIARRAANGAANSVGRWWIVFDRRWDEYAGFYAYWGGPIPAQSGRSLATVMDEVWAW